MNREHVGHPIGPFRQEYGWRDVVLYHLGIGARAEELAYLYERTPGGLWVYPTFGLTALPEPFRAALERFGVDPGTVLQGEHTTIFHHPIPAEGSFATTLTVTAAHDLGRDALLAVETRTEDGAGRLLFEARATLACAAAGGWGGDPAPRPVERPIPPGRLPEFQAVEKTVETQALLYRLSGDRGPLHVDLTTAQDAGLPRPILQSLCTYGYAARALVIRACGGDPARLREFGARFAAPVFPGQTLSTRGWEVGDGLYHLEVVTTEGDAVLAEAYARVG